jgi:hypothetical protein
MRRREENVENDPGAENNIKGARKKSIWASKPNCKGPGPVGPLLRTPELPEIPSSNSMSNFSSQTQFNLMLCEFICLICI